MDTICEPIDHLSRVFLRVSSAPNQDRLTLPAQLPRPSRREACCNQGALSRCHPPDCHSRRQHHIDGELPERVKWEAVNAGVGGATIADFTDLAPRLLQVSKPSLIVVTVGANDTANPNRQQNMEDLLSALKPFAPLVVIEPPKGQTVDGIHPTGPLRDSGYNRLSPKPSGLPGRPRCRSRPQLDRTVPNVLQEIPSCNTAAALLRHEPLERTRTISIAAS